MSEPHSEDFFLELIIQTMRLGDVGQVHDVIFTVVREVYEVSYKVREPNRN